MYSASFEYHAPSTLADAFALLDRFGDGAKLLAGSQSLVALMKLRLAQPGHVIDLRKVPGLVGVRESGGAIEIGAMTTHHAIGSDELVRAKLPMMSEAGNLVGDAQVRNMGTIGGSLAHADPAADWPAVLTALDATVVVANGKGERTVEMEDFIVGPLTTVLEPGEIVTRVRVPLPPARTAGAYEKLRHPASRFAIVGVAAEVSLDARGVVQWSRVAITGLAPKVARAAALERALQGKAADPGAIKTAAARAADGIELRDDLIGSADGIELRDDLIGSADYKAQLAAVYAERAVLRAVGRARER